MGLAADTQPLLGLHDLGLFTTIKDLAVSANCSENAKSSKAVVVLYSDPFCPILKFHTELVSELIAAIPHLLKQADDTRKNQSTAEDSDDFESGNEKKKAKEKVLHGNENGEQAQRQEEHDDKDKDKDKDKEEEEESEPYSVVAMILSPASDAFIQMALPFPFQLDLFDRMRLARIQMSETFAHVDTCVLLDDSFAKLQEDIHSNKLPKNVDMTRGRGGEDDSCLNKTISCLSEGERLQRILEEVTKATGISLELVTVLEQSQTDVYGIPPKKKKNSNNNNNNALCGKVVYVVTKRRSSQHSNMLVERQFREAGYSKEWIASYLMTVHAQIDTSKTEGVRDYEASGEDDSDGSWVTTEETNSEGDDDGDDDDDDDDDDDENGNEDTEEGNDNDQDPPRIQGGEGEGDGKVPGTRVYLSRMRPEEAQVRVLVKQGQGAQVLEPGVLEQIERSQLFVMQAIRKPRFVQMMGALSLGSGGSGSRSGGSSGSSSSSSGGGGGGGGGSDPGDSHSSRPLNNRTEASSSSSHDRMLNPFL